MDRVNDLHSLAVHRWRVALVLSIGMVAIYFGFILLVAFNKPLLAMDLANGLTLGIMMGASVILLAWVLTLLYVNWANNTYDRRVRELRG